MKNTRSTKITKKQSAKTSFLSAIIEIESCIQKDNENLEKCYTKSLAQIEKDFTVASYFILFLL
jgi:hypothetical protein